MPIYDYVCSACQHRLEVIHGVSEAGPHYCPSCGAEGTMKKAFVPPAIHFKGSGWAKKDRSATATPGKSRPAPSTESKTTSASGGGKATAGSSGEGTGQAATTSGGSDGD